MNELDIDKKKKYTYFVDKSLIEKLIDSEKIDVYGHGVNIKFLKLILNDEKCFSYVERYFNDEISEFRVSAVEDNNIIGNIWHPKALIIKGIEKLIKNKNLKLSDEAKERYDKLKKIISFDKFLYLNKEKYYNIEIEGTSYNISIKNIIDFFILNDAEYKKIYNSSVKNIYGMPKEYFIYAACMFISKNMLLTRYEVPEMLYDRYNEIRLGQKIDIYSVNKVLKTTDTKHKYIKINEELSPLILNDIPDNFNALEKAIYIYIKMCKVLTYDSEYYAANQKGYASLKHINMNYVNSITPENNKVVCFEFNLIYSKFLADLGINFETYYGRIQDGVYGSGHASLRFRYENYIISADSVLNILKSDLTYAKLNQPLMGLRCENINKDTTNKFKQIVNKVYKLIIDEEKIKEDKVDLHIHTYDELISEYIKHTDNVKIVDLTEKLSILLSKLNDSKLKQIDYFSYTLQLRKLLFNDEERNNNISTVIVSKSTGTSFSLTKQAYMIITVNENGFLSKPDKNKYYCLEDNGILIPITKEELIDGFNSGKLRYLEDCKIEIPGLIGKGISK